jgi:hypothetical protein
MLNSTVLCILLIIEHNGDVSPEDLITRVRKNRLDVTDVYFLFFP